MLLRLLTSLRLVLGVAALSFSLDGVELFLAATLITVTTIISGVCSLIGRRVAGRREVAADAFGAFFNGLAGYLTLVIVPWVLIQALLIGRRSLLQELLLGLPIVTGAVRFASAGRAAVAGSDAAGEVRGLDPVFFAFVSVTAVFLRLQAQVSPTQLTMILSPVVAVLSLLMIAPVRYPTLRATPGFAIAVLLFVAAMPFVMSEILAAVTIVAGLLFILIAPLLVWRKSG